jgi:cell wall-associated NlpC family hydrolase
LTALRAAPRDDAEQVSQLQPGEPLRLEHSDAGWGRVTTAYDYSGWLPTDALWPGHDECWLTPSTSEPAVSMALRYLDVPYLWGGMSMSGIDCSGLVHMALRAVGVLVRRDAHEQEADAAPIESPAVQAGDLVTYGTPVADHIAFWLGDGQILHATDRAGVHRVVAEYEPPDLAASRRGFWRVTPT